MGSNTLLGGLAGLRRRSRTSRAASLPVFPTSRIIRSSPYGVALIATLPSAFVNNRRPSQVPAGPDQCPDTGLRRLSYSQAWSTFKTASDGWTLHQPRHSALTTGEAGVSAILLQATKPPPGPPHFAGYAQPGVEAVVALIAEHDPGRRYPR